MLTKMAVLDGQLAMMVCGVDEGMDVCRNSSKRTYTEDTSQHDKNITDNVPEAHGVTHWGGSGQCVQATA